MKVAGLYLWNVSLRKAYFDLWVTTPHRSPALALKKAEKVLERMRKSGQGAFHIEGMKFSGTIDA